MNILVNCSNLKAGGGIQVADSLCRNLNRFPQHQFVVVLSNKLNYIELILRSYSNVRVEHYTTGNNIRSLITGRDVFLDNLVERYDVHAVLFVFGPSLWIPRVLTVSGYAMPHLVLPDSPFWLSQSIKTMIPIKFRNSLHKISFKKLSNCYYTENPFITERLKKLLPGKRIETITNTCHQVFDSPSDWKKDINLPQFDGLTLLTICAPYPHKNLSIIPKILDIIEAKFPELKVRFVLTCRPNDIPEVETHHKNHIIFLGRVEIDQCPWLYAQSNVMFLPTMLECFSANYVEAMKTGIPIITSNLGFATGLCGNAALYFNPIDPIDIASKINEIYRNENLRTDLINNGKIRLKSFDTPETRANKIIALIEDEFNKLTN